MFCSEKEGNGIDIQANGCHNILPICSCIKKESYVKDIISRRKVLLIYFCEIPYYKCRARQSEEKIIYSGNGGMNYDKRPLQWISLGDIPVCCVICAMYSVEGYGHFYQHHLLWEHTHHVTMLSYSDVNSLVMLT